MSYIALKKQIEQALQGAEQTMECCVISDMPLQPWLDLYLQEAWAAHGIALSVRHIGWGERHSALAAEGLRLIWPSPEVQQEIDAKWDPAGYWVSGEPWSNPLQKFYGAVMPNVPAPALPLGSRCLHLTALMVSLGLEKSLAAPAERRWGERYSAALQRAVAQAACRLWAAQHARRKKCLVLDCDGVLWGGIVSEDGLNGVLLGERGKGEAYARFQALLKQLSRHGVLLAICSKNDEADVRAVFDTKPEMVLQSSDIAAWAVGWQPKSEQIAKLSETLRIDVRDMVLIDDSEWEIAEVTEQFPSITGIVFRPDTITEELAQRLWLLPEDQNEQNRLRLQTYQDNEKREALRRSAGSYEAFLQKLATRLTLREATEADLPRISDLSRRVNQAGNGMRCSQEQLQAWLREGYHIQAALVSDRYRDLGLVGGVVLSPDRVTLELFCLSCRAMGRRLEQELLAALPPETVRLRWADTGKNAWLYELMLRERRWEL